MMILFLDESIDEISDDFDQDFIDDSYIELSIYNYPHVQNIANPIEVDT